MDGARKRGSGPRRLAAIALAGLPLLAGPAASGAMEPVAAPPEATKFRGASSAAEYWTLERIAAAEPLPLAGDDPEPAEPGFERFSSPTAAKSTIVDRPGKYPNRVHGLILGNFRGIGSFSCSGTVVSSGSRSLVSTAGHCVYDPGRRRFASSLAFVPGFQGSTAPYGVFGASRVITTGQWARRASLDYDSAMLRVKPNARGAVERVVGSRGIGFNQPRRQHLAAYGYPSAGGRGYNGRKLVRCDSGYLPDRRNHGGPRSRGMRCDMKFGSSGGGWVSQRSFIVSNVSHGHSVRKNKFYGPTFGAAVKGLYRANLPGWPSVGPIGCRGKVATIVGTSRGERIRGTGGKDVIATLGGNDRIAGKSGRDVICGGTGRDRIAGSGGRDRIDGGEGADRCNGGKGNDGLRRCERKRRP